MIDTLWGLALATAAFYGLHLVPSIPGLRPRLVGWLTLRGYRSLFSLVAAATFAWLIVAHPAPYTEIWQIGSWARLIPLVVMPFALCLLILVYTAPVEAKKIARHPMLISVLLWALAHILPNGDAGSLILFGGTALFALVDMPLADARLRRTDPAACAELARRTSFDPFVALAQGRAGGLDLRKVMVRGVLPAIILYLVILFAHEFVFGFSALP